MTRRPAAVRVAREGQELMMPVPDLLVARLGAEVGDSFHASAANGVLVYRPLSDAPAVTGHGPARILTTSKRGIPPLNTWDF